jgi:hypothetical protein
MENRQNHRCINNIKMKNIKTNYALTSIQEKELLISLQESFDPKNLSTHDKAIKAHSKWLKISDSIEK